MLLSVLVRKGGPVAVGIEMGVALDRLWGELQQEVGETDDGVLSVAAEDLPGPPRTGLPRGSPDQDVVFAKLQRELTREREAVRGEAVAARYARLPQDDPARLAYKARGPTTALITQSVVWADEPDKRRVLLEQLSACSGRTIIFVETKRAAEQLVAHAVDRLRQRAHELLLLLHARRELRLQLGLVQRLHRPLEQPRPRLGEVVARDLTRRCRRLAVLAHLDLVELV